LTSHLPARGMELLADVVRRQDPKLEARLATLGQVALTDDEREAYRQAILRELLETGLTEDDEPNTRGNELEELIDHLGRL
jgi:hypothetical protein